MNIEKYRSEYNRFYELLKTIDTDKEEIEIFITLKDFSSIRTEYRNSYFGMECIACNGRKISFEEIDHLVFTTFQLPEECEE